MGRRQKRRDNVEVRFENQPKNGRNYVIERAFAHPNGIYPEQKFSLWLSRDELEAVLDLGDELLDGLDHA